MQTIGYKGLLKLITPGKRQRGMRTFLQGYFGGSPRIGFPAYQLVFGSTVPLMARGVEVGNRIEYDVVNIVDGDNGLPKLPPDVYLHADYSEAETIRLLLAHEVKHAQSNGTLPLVRARQAFWGHQGIRGAHFTVDAGDNVDHAIHNKVYYLELGSGPSIHIASFAFEEAGRGGCPHWLTDEKATADYVTRIHILDPKADDKTAESPAEMTG